MTDRDALLNLVTQVSGESFLKVEETFGDGYVRLRVSEAERRQAKHDIRSFEDIVVELLRNSRDAHAHRIFVATSRDSDRRTMTVVDDGVGIPEGMHDRIFEPRVTSKLDTMVEDRWGVHGRGMALFSIRSNSATARIAASAPHKGASIQIITQADDLNERADQSTWPTVERGDDGQPRVARGPHNIVRRVVEYALEHPESKVYLGSPTEIVATLHAVGHSVLASSDLLFADLERLPLWQRPAAAPDAAELVDIACELGLAISERSAHRILAGEIAPLETVMALAAGPEPQIEVTPATPDIYRDRRGLKIHQTDLADFKRELQHAFDVLSERYYLNLRSEPRVTVGRDQITVRFEVDKDD
jgi:hypothetical protein